MTRNEFCRIHGDQSNVKRGDMFLPIERHPLGEQIKLGTFFDASRNVFLPQWRNMSDIDPKKLLITKTPDTKFALSVSMEELRKNNELELNGSVAVDFRIFKVSKSIEFLQCSRNTRTEARVDITCTRKNREQKIPMEVISEMSQDQQLERQQSNATHFVSEVHEGATANITFKKSCNSTKEADKLSIDMSKKLKSTLKKKFGVTGVDRETDFEQFEVNIQCPFAISIGSFDDVMSQAKTLPKRLKQYNNTLLVRLLPIHLILPNVVQTVYRPINDQTLKQLISTIRRAENNDYELESLTFNENFCEDLLTSQRNSFQGHFSSCIDEFRDTVRDSLHELRSESDSPNICLCKLAKSTNRMGQQCLISEVYSTSKIDEKKYIAGLKDHSGSCSSDMLQKFIDRNHPLEKELYKNSPNLDTSDWFNDKQNRKDLRSKIEVQKKIEEVQAMKFEWQGQWSGETVEVSWKNPDKEHLLEYVVSWGPNNSTKQSSTMDRTSERISIKHYYNQPISEACRNETNPDSLSCSFDLKARYSIQGKEIEVSAERKNEDSTA